MFHYWFYEFTEEYPKKKKVETSQTIVSTIRYLFLFIMTNKIIFYWKLYLQGKKYIF